MTNQNQQNPQELIYWLILHHAPKLSILATLKLLQHYSCAQIICSEKLTTLQNLGLNQQTCAYIKNLPLAKLYKEIDWAQKPNHHIITLWDSNYPALLKTIADPPLLLYVWGDILYLNRPQIAIVGSRNSTPAGKEIADQLARNLVHANLVITSGLAIGIDSAAHRGALNASGYSIAVLGSGLENIYPRRNHRLGTKISENGAIISEFSLNAPPLPAYFPQRNRIISGLSFGTVVVEATQFSGSLITARLANDQGREVFAVPGSVLNTFAIGCHQLIQQGAKLTQCHTDIVEELPNYPGKPNTSLTTTTQLSLPNCHTNLDHDHSKLVECIGFEITTVEQIIERSGFFANSVATILLNLELHGYIKCVPGGYIRVKNERRKCS